MESPRRINSASERRQHATLPSSLRSPDGLLPSVHQGAYRTYFQTLLRREAAGQSAAMSVHARRLLMYSARMIPQCAS